ncbi:alanine--tRNA ligase [Fulvivirgaceae bacterium BMA10]|uniref:Alanine--tRNA ligase n=1 Tax=Splendidivirga corallicola TaxID=3051826 RepID=A0ABT8KGD8_9BACT|nr:alanine--tRNA ligase [Fulvivirgaceae bacterium BMA10]
MDSKTIRKRFIAFFEEKNHQFVPSSPLVVKNDPTLMFINAGMNQFKDFFLGNKEPQYARAVNSQKCLRVSGKHNDLEEVGKDTYHHTMFEMLGNWSFGDYFKKEAIEWAWELLTEVYELPKERLYVSVFGGDAKEELELDQEAYDIWKGIISEDRIIYGSKKDNFWEMGDTGPCGPCSEIHIDLRPQSEVDKVPGADLVNKDHPLVVEIWNLVFMQFNRLASGELENLPAKHVDTGMGFERLAMAIQGKESNYDTDVFTPIIEYIAKKAGVKYGHQESTDIAIRVIVDHIRAISFAIADGQLPSNNKAGYVIRRILRRAVRYGYTFLHFQEPFLYELLPIVGEQFKDIFPEVNEQKGFIAKVIREEEVSFLRTLENGLKKLDQIKAELKGESRIIDGKTVFELYDTFGFPVDLTSLIARENGLSVDEEGFKEEMEIQKQRSKKAAEVEKGDWVVLREDEDVEFVGYESLESKTNIVKYREISEKNKTHYQIVLDKTPFYAESGGQIGDTGYIEADGEKISVIDTKKENDLIVHFTKKLPAKLDVEMHCVVNGKKRQLTMDNHSATHLLHAALKQVLGDHVQQKGSYVSDEVLRFDFSHYAKMTAEEVAHVEEIVNRKIRENISLREQRNVPIEEAKKMGATALFGEKYGDFVRVITFDKNFSVELCGGTHVEATGQIGSFKIISESSIAAGVRRIEAVTADGAEEYVNQHLAIIQDLTEVLKNPKDLKKAVETLIEDKNKLTKEIEQIHQKQTNDLKVNLTEKITKQNDVNVLVEKVNLPKADALKDIAFGLKAQTENLFLILAANVNDKPQVTVMISENLVSKKGLNAGNIVKELAQEIKGGGGGQAFYATAGGKDLTGLDKVVEKGLEKVKEIFQ